MRVGYVIISCMEDGFAQANELRSTNADLLVDNERLSAENAELKLRVEGLEARIAKLEAQLGQNSSNSSMPPSSDTLEERKEQTAKRATRRAAERAAAKAARRPGKQPGDAGHHLARVENPTRVVTHSPKACEGCGSTLDDAPLEGVESRQVFDLSEIKVQVTEHMAERRRCGCGTCTTAAFPTEAKAPTCWGPNVEALGLYLVGRQHIPIARAAEFLSDACGTPVSTGWLAGVMARGAAGLEPFMAHIADGLASGAILHLDETGARISGVRHWFHTASSEFLTYLFCHQKRGDDALKYAAILSRFRGTAVHDCWGPYFSYTDCKHQLCAAHLLRELEAIVDDPTHEGWAAEMTTLLLNARTSVEQAQLSGATALPTETLTELDSAYARITERGMAAGRNPGAPHTWWSIDRKAFNLAKRMADRSDQVLGFTRDFSVPFTNNQAERDLRMVKLQQKISGCFRTLSGARAFATVRSYIQTAAKQDQSIFEALVQLVQGDPWKPEINLSG